MFKKLLLVLALIGVIVLTTFGALSGTYTTNSIFYRPGYGSYGLEEYNAYNAAMEVADNAIKDNQVAFGSYYLKTEINTLPKVEAIYVKDITDSTELAAALGAYYLKTDINTQAKVEAIWGVSLANDSELHTQNTDTDLDATFEATFAKKADKLSVFAATTSAELAGVITDEIGTDKLVYNTSPTLVTPILGVASATSLTLTTDLAIADGGTGQSTAQLAINALTAVSGATDEYVLTKDTATGNAVYKVVAGAGETNTASNIGSQAEIFKQKTGVDLELRTLKAGSNKIIVTHITEGDLIDIGEPAEVRASGGQSQATVVNMGNPANGSGIITSIEIYARASISNCEIATFFVVSGDNLSTRDTEVIGTVTQGAKRTFEVNLEVQTGDYIGLYFTAGSIEYDTSGGSGMWMEYNDRIPCTNQLFNNMAGDTISLYGTGIIGYEDFVRFDVVPLEIAKEIGGLLSTTTVSFAADADTTLYTVPTGKRCVLSHAIVVAADDAGATTTLSIGQDTAETDFIPANTLSNLDAQYDSVILQPIPNTTPLKIKSYAAATVIQAQVATQSGAAGNTIYLFGITY